MLGAAEFTCASKGLHTGNDCRVTVRPGAADGGYLLRAGGGAEIRIRPTLADGSRHRTVLQFDGVEVHTVEHLLSALFGMGVDNAAIEVEGGEIPGMDGSAKVFCDRIREAGLIEQEAETQPAAPREAVAVAEGGASIVAFPAKDGVFRVTYLLNYPESRLAHGTAELAITPETFAAETAPARTFVMKAHVEAMLKAGHGKGATPENTLVLDGDAVQGNQLRFPDECARHKALDVVGDLATIGRRLAVHVVAYRSGHGLNLELARRLVPELNLAAHPKGLLDIRQIEKTLPHRYPFLLVDRVLEIEPRRRIVALKNVTRNEEFFQGHFPGQPIMPGVLQLEALAQTGCILMMIDPAGKGKLAVLMGFEEVKYRRPVVPGDQVRMEVLFEKFKGRMGVVYARSRVDGEVATEAKIKFALVDAEQYT